MAIKTTGSAPTVRESKETERMEALTKTLGVAQAACEAHTLAQILYGQIASARMQPAIPSSGMPVIPGLEAVPGFPAVAMPMWNVMWPNPLPVAPANVRMVPLPNL